MSSDTFKSEHQRIVDLEQAMHGVLTRLDRLERCSPAGGWMPWVWIPAGWQPGGERLPGGCGEPVSDQPLESGASCRVAAELSQEGSFDYKKNLGANDPCPAFSPGDLAKAALEAEARLLEFGETRCAAGNDLCRSRSCRPFLSGTVKVGEGVISSRVEDGRKICSVTVKVTGTVACRCSV